jgi:hypothetical protein
MTAVFSSTVHENGEKKLLDSKKNKMETKKNTDTAILVHTSFLIINLKKQALSRRSSSSWHTQLFA